MPSPVLVNARSPIPVQAERLGRLEDRLARLDAQIATGERFTEPAEDPAGANRAAMLVRLNARLEDDRRSLDRASSRLGLAETAMRTAGDALVRARELAIAAANGAYGPDERTIIGKEVEVLRAQLLDSANARDDGGRFLFAGAGNGAAAYAPDAAGVIQWQGFGDAPGAEAAGVAVGAPPRGPDLFGDATTGAFAQLAALANALVEPDAATRAAAFAGVLDGLETSHTRLVTAQAVVGARMARLDGEGERIAAARLDVAEGLAAAKGLDLTAAIAELQALELTRSAAQASFSRIYADSLFDRLG
jgi:flagellar hook-associated protein 3 FlgL